MTIIEQRDFEQRKQILKEREAAAPQEHFYIFSGVKYANRKALCQTFKFNNFTFKVLREKGIITMNKKLNGYEQKEETTR